MFALELVSSLGMLEIDVHLASIAIAPAFAVPFWTSSASPRHIKCCNGIVSLYVWIRECRRMMRGHSGCFYDSSVLRQCREANRAAKFEGLEFCDRSFFDFRLFL
jgi:hypothetical protein